MIQLTIDKTANQTLSSLLDEASYKITLKALTNGMFIDIERDDVMIIQGLRIVGNTPIIPYPYLEHGNFILATQNGDIPDYTQFGTTQFLYYVTVEELEIARA